MPYGKGTYGTKKGRPSNAAKAKAKKNMTPPDRDWETMLFRMP